MSLLSVIKGDVDAINDALSELLTRVNAQKHMSMRRSKLIPTLSEISIITRSAELVSRTLTEAKNAFVIPGESIDPQIQATTTKLEALKAEAATRAPRRSSRNHARIAMMPRAMSSRASPVVSTTCSWRPMRSRRWPPTPRPTIMPTRS